ncbi:hypothetical protein [Halobacterium zhouii]|uniref:hypothetical protein n=1 Tax=Halobacterium zhouii TaxID=2902624 RepID=UPI001E4485C1|nr:hypothetical protein [Halobacterium zhouii]
MRDPVEQRPIDKTHTPSTEVQQSYVVVADPQEVPIDIAPEHDGIICVGDILRLAPPPDHDPEGSLLDAFVPETKDLYTQGDISGILDAVRSLNQDSRVHEGAARRYAAFFEQMERDFYYIAGNQDIPRVLATTAAVYDHVAPVSDCPGFLGIDGLVPSFAGLPTNTFPGECSRKTFEEQLTTTDEPILVAHRLPEQFIPSDEGFEIAITTTDGIAGTQHEGVLSAPSYRETGATAELTVTPTSETDGDAHLIEQIEVIGE